MDKIKQKIVKLLALAIDQAGNPEGELASRKAMELMEEWGIAKGDVDPSKDGCQMHRKVVEVGSTGWMYSISAAVGKITGCYVAAGGGEAWLIGREIDTEIAAYLIESLMNQCKKNCNNWRRERKGLGWDVSRVDTNVFKESWAAGLAEKVAKIVRMRQQQTGESTSQSQALTTIGRTAVASRWANTQWRFGNAGRRSRTGNQDGRAAGRSANVQGGVKGRGQRRLGS